MLCVRGMLKEKVVSRFILCLVFIDCVFMVVVWELCVGSGVEERVNEKSEIVVDEKGYWVEKKNFVRI